MQVQEIIGHLILSLTVCISAFLQSANATTLLIKPGSGENKQDEMPNTGVSYELPGKYTVG